MKASSLRAALLLGAVIALAACGGKNDKATYEAAVDSMSVHRDSTIRALDTSKTGAANGQIDTTKLGAKKTESILTKARKSR